MTGLDYKKDVIIEIAVLITDGNLEIVDEGLEFVIKTDKRALDDMGPWCKEHHGKVSPGHCLDVIPHSKLTLNSTS